MQGYGNYYQNTPPMTPTPTLTTTATTTTTTTLSSLESSGSDHFVEGTDFEVSDFFSNFEEWGIAGAEAESESMGFVQDYNYGGYQGNEFYDHHDQLVENSHSQNEGENSIGDNRSCREKKEAKGRIAFRMRTDIDVLADGYKWRKYGKKMVKNSPNPRNYYRCSTDNCPVKKRVERDREDPQYVITTYEGIHTHEAPRQ